MVHTLKLGWLNKEGIWFVIGLINLQFASGSQVSQHLDDVLGHGWGNGQVVTGGLETVLIGNPGDGVGHSFFGVREFALGDDSGFFGFVTDLFLDSALADDDAVLGFVAERVLLFLGVMVLGLALDEDDGGRLLEGSSGGNSQEDGDQDHLPVTNKTDTLLHRFKLTADYIYRFAIQIVTH